MAPPAKIDRRPPPPQVGGGQFKIKRRNKLEPLASKRTKFKVVAIAELVLIALICNQVSCKLTNWQPEGGIPQPSVQLAKFGLIRARNFLPTADEGGTKRVSWPVAAFLGVPYAAPPTGPLRFMPPGAARPKARGTATATTTNEQHELCRLLPSRKAIPSRPFASFGAECVHLASWSPGEASAATESRHQSEDCLNLNLFVPYEPMEQVPLEHELVRRDQVGNQEPLAGGPTRSQAEAQAQAAESELPHSNTSTATLDGRIARSLSDKSISLNGSTTERDQDQGDRPTTCYLEQLNLAPGELAGRRQRKRRRQLPVLVLFHSARRRRRPPASGELADGGQANSLAFVEVARRSQSIVVTFNYRIGLLGYLPYIDDLNEFQSSSSASSGDTGQTRYNHAIWDQLGLLHWLRHNVANFNGDPNNITLASTDNKSAKLIQLLAMSPISKGLFARLVIVHDQRRDADEDSTMDYFDQLLELATKWRGMKRKLVNEIALVVKRMTGDNNFKSGGGDNNLETDRNTFAFLKSANLSQLASLERELVQLKLIDYISEPSLDDRMLFPFFAQLIRKRLQQHLHRLNGTKSTDPSNNLSTLPQRVHGNNIYHDDAGDDEASTSFQQVLALLSNRFELNETGRGQLMEPMDVATNRIELDYCLYLGRMYDFMYDKMVTLDGKKSNSEATMMSLKDLNEIDPFRLLPRISEQKLRASLAQSAQSNQSQAVDSQQQHKKRLIQKTSSLPWLSPWSWFQRADESDQGNQGDGDFKHDAHWSGRGPNWEQNRLASAAEFYHLRHVHLLNQLLVQKHAALNRINHSESTDSRQDNYLDDLYGKTTSDQSTDEEEGGGDGSTQLNLVAAQGQGARTKRDTLTDQLHLLGNQLIELFTSYDLLIGFIGEPVTKTFKIRSSNGSSIEALLKQTNHESLKLDAQLAFWLHVADLHFVSNTFKKHADQFSRNLEDSHGNNCDFISDKIQYIKQQSQGSPSQHKSPAKYSAGGGYSTHILVVVEDNKRDSNGIESNNTSIYARNWISETNSSLTQAVLGYQDDTDATAASWPTYDTMHRRVKLIGTNSDLRSSEIMLKEQVDLQLNLVPYLERYANKEQVRSLSSLASDQGTAIRSIVAPPPSEQVLSCLSDLGTKLNETTINVPSISSLGKFSDDSRCLARESSKLRGQLRRGASKDLEPLFVHFLMASSTSIASWSLMSAASNSSDNQYGKQFALLNTSQRVSSMTTRNLVNQSEGMFLDQMDPTSNSLLKNNDQASELRGPSLADSSVKNASVFGVYSNNKQAASTSNNTSASTIRSFFAKTYKDAVGQALGIVIGTGALIFLLNLVIVLVIALRSSRTSNQQGGESGSKTSRRIQDVNQMNYLTTSNVSANGKSNAIGNEATVTTSLLQQDFQINGGGIASSSNLISGNGKNSTPNLTSDNKLLLTSSFKQQVYALNEGQKGARKRSVKSIKFDLSSVGGGGVNDNRAANGNDDNANIYRHINKQPINTSEDLNCEDHNSSMQFNANLSDSAINGRCLIHGQQTLADDFGVNLMVDGNDERLHYQQQTLSSPPSYLMNELSDEIDLDQLSADEERHQLQLQNALHLADQGGRQPIYVAHHHEANSVNDDYLTTAALPGCHYNSQNQGHHHHNHQLQQHHINRSLGSSSLNSPFASQSTPTNNTPTASTAIYTIQPQQQQLEVVGVAGNQQQLYSPQLSHASTNSASGDGTPVQAPERTAATKQLVQLHQASWQRRQHLNAAGLLLPSRQESVAAPWPNSALDSHQANSISHHQGNHSYLIYTPVSLANNQREQQAATNTNPGQQQPFELSGALDSTSVRLLIMPCEQQQQE